VEGKSIQGIIERIKNIYNKYENSVLIESKISESFWMFTVKPNITDQTNLFHYT
jgi:hypothetical protein